MRTLTFYSYKGGTGRSLLLANTALHLALLGQRVVALDFDFEAPGLHFKLNVSPPGKRTVEEIPERGAVDYLLTAVLGVGTPKSLLDYVVSVSLPPAAKGSLHLFPAGSAPTGGYWKSLSALVSQDLLNDPDGSGIAACLELKARIEKELRADFLLIDSGKGVTALAGVTTTVLADTVVCLMLANRESQLGARAVLRSLRHATRLAGQAAIEVLPVLSRVPEHDEVAKTETLEFLNEPGSTSEATLELDRLCVLRTDVELARRETLHIGSGEAPGRSPLHQDYLALMSELFDGDTKDRVRKATRRWKS